MMNHCARPVLIPLFCLWFWGGSMVMVQGSEVDREKGRSPSPLSSPSHSQSADFYLAQRSILPDYISPIFAPVELEWLNESNVPPDRNIITSAMISSSGLTPPSLWWTRQQVGGKLLRGWIAYPTEASHPAYVDLIVSRQLWGLSDYLERYSFVHHFGQAAQSFGYMVRVFNDVGEYLAIYPCVVVREGSDRIFNIDLTQNSALNPTSEPDPNSDVTALSVEPSDETGADAQRQTQSCPTIFGSSGLGVLQDNTPFSEF